MKFTPHIAFWISVPIILLYGLSNNYGPFDNGVHDSPMIMNQLTFSFIGAIIFSIIGFGYWKIKKNNLSKNKSLTHWAVSFGSFIAFWLSGIIKYSFDFGSNVSTSLWDGRFNAINSSLLLLMVLSHFLFLQNLKRNKQ
jgi:hypothetical protein